MLCGTAHERSRVPVLQPRRGRATIAHAHRHLIPRYRGDTPNPRGGVRGVIPDQQSY
jgi:diadenosine tetraphosphate (Ap4A) HIT family hydrolase